MAISGAVCSHAARRANKFIKNQFSAFESSSELLVNSRCVNLARDAPQHVTLGAFMFAANALTQTEEESAMMALPVAVPDEQRMRVWKRRVRLQSEALAVENLSAQRTCKHKSLPAPLAHSPHAKCRQAARQAHQRKRLKHMPCISGNSRPQPPSQRHRVISVWWMS
jgi:hypothetical protein